MYQYIGGGALKEKRVDARYPPVYYHMSTEPESYNLATGEEEWRQGSASDPGDQNESERTHALPTADEERESEGPHDPPAADWLRESAPPAATDVENLHDTGGVGNPDLNELFDREQESEVLPPRRQAESLDEEDLDEEERKALAEVARKGYYHGRPLSSEQPPPQRIQAQCATGQAVDGQFEWVKYQKKWNKFDDDAFNEQVMTEDTQSCERSRAQGRGDGLGASSSGPRRPRSKPQCSDDPAQAFTSVAEYIKNLICQLAPTENCIHKTTRTSE